MVALNGSDKKGSLSPFSRYPFPENRVYVCLGALLFAVYLIGTFGSALSIIYAWNASNTSGHTKKGAHYSIKLPPYLMNFAVTINAMTLVAFALGNIVGESNMRFSVTWFGFAYFDRRYGNISTARCTRICSGENCYSRSHNGSNICLLLAAMG